MWRLSLPLRASFSSFSSRRRQGGRAGAAVFLPWAARPWPSYATHEEEWRHLDRALSAVVGMPPAEVAARALRLCPRRLLDDVEDPVEALRRRRREEAQRRKKENAGENAEGTAGEKTHPANATNSTNATNATAAIGRGSDDVKSSRGRRRKETLDATPSLASQSTVTPVTPETTLSSTSTTTAPTTATAATEIVTSANAATVASSFLSCSPTTAAMENTTTTTTTRPLRATKTTSGERKVCNSPVLRQSESRPSANTTAADAAKGAKRRKEEEKDDGEKSERADMTPIVAGDVNAKRNNATAAQSPPQKSREPRGQSRGGGNKRGGKLPSATGDVAEAAAPVASLPPPAPVAAADGASPAGERTGTKLWHE